MSTSQTSITPFSASDPIQATVDSAGGAFENGTASSNMPVITGTGEPNLLVNIYDGVRLLGSTTADATGHWSYTSTTALKGGKHSFTAISIGADGVNGLSSEPLHVTLPAVDTGVPAPEVPSITGVLDTVGAVTGNVGQNGTTDDTQPTISGNGHAGEIVKLYDGSTLLGSATVDASGKWSIKPATPLADGPHDLSATATNSASVTSAASAHYGFTVDTVSGQTPGTPTIGAITDHIGPVQGPIAPNGTTDDPKPTISGTGKPGDIINVFDNGSPIGTTTVKPDNTWSLTPANPLGDGPHAITVTETTPGGVTGPATPPVTINVDTTTPTTPSITGVLDTVGTVTGNVGQNGTTDDTQPTISGSGHAGEIVKLYDGSTLLGSATVDASGKWSIKPATPLADGLHDLSATATNSASVTSAVSAHYGFTVDTVSGQTPGTPTIGAITDHVGPVQGPIAPNGTTDDPKPTISGTGKPGDIINVFDNGSPIGTTTVKPDNTWSLTPANPLGDGPHAITVTETTPGGVTGPATPPVTINVDTTMPVTPSITGVLDHTGAVTGNVAMNGSTDEVRPIISGTGHAGDTITIKDNATVLGSATVGSDGKWTFVPATDLPTGIHHLTAVATNAAGAISSPSADFAFTIDTTAATTPEITQVLDAIGKVTGNVASGSQTDDHSPTITGKGHAGDTITILDGTSVLGAATVAANGTWSFKPSYMLNNGLHNLTATATNSQGTSSAPSNLYTFTIAADPIAPVITYLVGQEDGRVLHHTDSTSDRSFTLHGTGGAGDIVKVFDTQVRLTIYSTVGLLGSTVVDANGNWSFYAPNVPFFQAANGNQLATFAVMTSTGVGAGGAAYTIYYGTPTLTQAAEPYITNVIDGFGAVTGPIYQGATTDDTHPTVKGTAHQGDTIKIYDNGSLIGSTVTNSNGDWTFTPGSALLNGAHNLTAIASASGLADSKASGGYGFYVAPDPVVGIAQTPSITYLWDDFGAKQGNIPSGTTTDDHTPTLQGRGHVADIIKIYDGGNLLGSTQVDGNGNWSFTPAALLDGTHNITAAASANGQNTSTPSAPYTFTIAPDPAPAVPVIASVTAATTFENPLLVQRISQGTTIHDIPLLEGTGVAGMTIKIYNQKNELQGYSTVDATGHWSVFATVYFGNQTLHAVAVNSAGVVSGSSNTFTLVQALISNHADTVHTGLTLFEGGTNLGNPPDNGYGVIHIRSGATLQLSYIGGPAGQTVGNVYVEGTLVKSNAYVGFDFAPYLTVGTHRIVIAAPSTGLLPNVYWITVDAPGTTPVTRDALLFDTADDHASAAALGTDADPKHHSTDANDTPHSTVTHQTVELAADPAAHFKQASAHVEGAHDGKDSIVLTGDHQILDLSSLTGKTAAAKISGIEVFDLSGHHNTLKVSLLDVLNLGEQDLFVKDGKQQVVVKGQEGDSVDLSNTHIAGVAEGQWEQHGTEQVGGVTYAVYEHSGAHVELLVQQGVSTVVH